MQWKEWCWSWGSSTLSSWWEEPTQWKWLMLGKIEGKRRRGLQTMRWLGSIVDSMDVNLSKLQEMVEDRGARHDAIHRVAKSGIWLDNWSTTIIHIVINLRLVQMVKKKKTTFIIDILVVTVIQAHRKFCFNHGEVYRMKLFILFLEKKVHLTVKVAGKIDSKMSFLLSFFLWIWLHGLVSRELFHPDRWCTRSSFRNTSLWSHKSESVFL